MSLSSPIIRIAVMFLLGGMTVVAFYFSSSINTATESGVTMALPSMVDGFIGTDVEPSEGEKTILPKDTEIIKKSYKNQIDDQLIAQIVLAGVEKRSIHRPELCLPAQGWAITRHQAFPVTLSDGRSISVMADYISRPVEINPGVTRTLNAIYCYWFVGKGITTSSHITRVFLTSWDRVVHHKNHRWAYVAVSAPVLEGFKKEGKNESETQEMIADFIAKIGPAVMKR